MDEQPEEQFEETQPDGGQDVSSILSSGLKGQEDSPNDVTQAEEQPEAEQTPETQAEELFGKLVLDQEKSVPLKSQEDLEALIEANKELFEKTGHYLRQSDYTRKTQELSREREEFEALRGEEEAKWGDVQPDDQSMSAFRNLWTVFQHGGQQLQGHINAFMQDVNLISSGQPPQGPLASGEGQSSAVNPEVIALRQELADLRRQNQTTEQKFSQTEQTRLRQDAERSWNAWTDSMKSNGVVIDPKMEQAMVPYIAATNPNWEPSKRLDVAYKMACEELGISSPIEKGKVIREAKDKMSKTPKAPSAKASATTQPEPKDVEGILRAAQEQLSA